MNSDSTGGWIAAAVIGALLSALVTYVWLGLNEPFNYGIPLLVLFAGLGWSARRAQGDP